MCYICSLKATLLLLGTQERNDYAESVWKYLRSFQDKHISADTCVEGTGYTKHEKYFTQLWDFSSAEYKTIVLNVISTT